METTRRIGKKKIGKHRKSNAEEKVFSCRRWEHISRNCRVKEQKEVATLQSPNKFKVLTSRIMNVGEESRGEVKKDKRTVLREERIKKGKKKKKKKKKESPAEVRKTVVEGDDSKNSVGKNRYIGENYSESIVE